MLRGEMQKLMKVPTTVKEAKQILKRNEVLMNILVECSQDILGGSDPGSFKFHKGNPFGWRSTTRDFFYRGVTIGCPHCVVDHCSKCSWQEYNSDVYGLNYKATKCLYAKFYGKTIVSLLDESIYFKLYYSIKEAAFAFDYDSISTLEIGDKVIALNRLKREVEDVCRFLLGHIEWAKLVIKKGGVK